MGQLENARKILTDTENSLRGLIERALSEQQYGDVAGIARMADAVARLLRGSDEETQLPSPAGTRPSSHRESNGGAAALAQDSSAPKAVRKRRPTKGEYPRFERDGDRLIKIGWSKRDDRVYEHRASRETVFLVTNALSSKVKPKAVFTMDKVLPLNDNGGNEIPSYQAYLALAWLRSIGAVQRRGKDGYTLANGSLESSKLQRLWNATPSRP